MKKEYMKPMAWEKEMMTGEMLAGSDTSILSVDGDTGTGTIQNINAESSAMGKHGIWFYLDD